MQILARLLFGLALIAGTGCATTSDSDDDDTVGDDDAADDDTGDDDTQFDYEFEGGWDFALAYFTFHFMLYGEPTLPGYASAMGEACACPTLTGSWPEFEAEGGCVGNDEGMFAFEGHLSQTGNGTDYHIEYDHFGWDLEDGFMGAWAHGAIDRSIIDETADDGLWENTIEELEITLLGPWIPWDGAAFPGHQALTIEFRDTTFHRQVFLDHVEDTFDAVVTIPGDGSYRAHGAWEWNRSNDPCDSAEPVSGELVIEGANTVTFEFGGDTCDFLFPYTVDDGTTGEVDKNGNVPVLGPTC